MNVYVEDIKYIFWGDVIKVPSFMCFYTSYVHEQR